MENKSNTQPEPGTLAATLMAAAMEPRQIQQAHFLVLPPGYQQVDITASVEKAGLIRNRKSGAVQLASVDSLVQYLMDQDQSTNAYVYADIADRTITAVFNDQRSQTPGWRDHRASYKAEHTPEWALWVSRNKQKMDQTSFAEFIEDNITDLNGDEASLLLNVATTIAAKTDINFSSAKRLDNGQNQLVYNEVINATAGANGELKIPNKFKLGICIFKNGDPYAVTARLKYRLNGGQVHFFYELERPERSVEDAFNSYIDKVRNESGYTVLLGKA